MRKLSAIFCALVVCTGAARGDWSVVSTRSEFSAERRVERRHVELKSDAGTEATLEFAIFSSKSATLRVLDDPNANSNLAAMMQRENCLAGTNGGYFDPDYAPVGLLVSRGQVVAPLRKAKLLSGVVAVENGRVRIQRPNEFSLKTKPTEARQCGPFLLDRGKPITGLNATREARRTFVVTGAGGKAALGFSSYVTLAQLAEILATPEIAPDLKIQRALNLDGGSSSGFWFAGRDGVFSISEQKTVRDYLAIVPK